MLNKHKKIKKDQDEEKKKEDIAIENEETELDKLKKQTEDNLNGWKRCQADFENYKKMQAESQKEFIKYANQNIVLQIIPVLDNFHMSTDHIPEDQKDGGWVVGIMHIQKQLENVLAENGIEEIPAKEGDKFDPTIHEAMQDNNQESGDKKQEENQEPKNIHQELIKKVLLKGYKLNGKIIRPVKVTVK